MNEAIKRDRFCDEPIISRATGKPVAVEIQDDDVRLFYALSRHYHYLSPEYVAPLLGRTYDPITRRMRLLKRNGHYLRLSPDQKRNERQNYWGNLFYAIAPAGHIELEKARYPKPPRRPAPVNLKHQVFIDQMMASIELGVMENGHLKLKWWDELLQSEQMPEVTRRSQSVVVWLERPNPDHPESKGRFLCADGTPFVLSRTFGERTEHMFFIGFEADTGSQSYTVLRQKFLHYIEMLERGLHTETFGAETLFVVFATPERDRLDEAKRILEELTEHKPSLRKSFLFTTHPLYTSREKPRATGHMVTEKLERVGYPSVTLTEPIDNTPIQTQRGGDRSGRQAHAHP